MHVGKEGRAVCDRQEGGREAQMFVAVHQELGVRQVVQDVVDGGPPSAARRICNRRRSQLRSNQVDSNPRDDAVTVTVGHHNSGTSPEEPKAVSMSCSSMDAHDERLLITAT